MNGKLSVSSSSSPFTLSLVEGRTGYSSSLLRGTSEKIAQGV
jgi:hypothetical protein